LCATFEYSIEYSIEVLECKAGDVRTDPAKQLVEGPDEKYGPGGCEEAAEDEGQDN